MAKTLYSVNLKSIHIIIASSRQHGSPAFLLLPGLRLPAGPAYLPVRSLREYYAHLYPVICPIVRHVTIHLPGLLQASDRANIETLR